jgi:DNA-binding CsgD family transcriptional regulator
METEYPIWRIWSKGKDSYKDIAENWTLSEVVKANALLDMQETIEMSANEAQGED